MATKRKVSKQVSNPAVVKAIVSGVASLYNEHEDKIMSVLGDSEQKTITVNFAVDIDQSETQPILEVKIRFSESVTDKRVARLEDPNQETFQFVRPDQFERKELGLDGGKAEDAEESEEAEKEA